MINPKLALIPSAYKASKIYSVLPSNGDGDFAFTRNTTATRINKEGFVEEVAVNIPRLDYRNGNCPDILFERASTNLCLYSQSNFNDQVNWLKYLAPSNLTITEDDVISPDGTLTGAKIEYVNNGSDGIFTQNVTVVNGEDYVLSIWLKGEQGGEVVKLRLSNSSGGSSGTKDTFTLTDEWVRYETDIKVADATDRGFQIRVEDTDNPLGATFYAWGAQLENNPYASSYIPTEATTISRSQDRARESMLNGDITSPKFTFFIDVRLDNTPIGTSDRFYKWSMNNSDDADRVELVVNVTSSVLNFRTTYNEVVLGNIAESVTLAPNDRIKMAIVSTDVGFDAYYNGTFVGSNSNGTLDTSSLTEISSDGGVFNPFSGYLKDLRYYDEQLTEAELIELTTL